MKLYRKRQDGVKVADHFYPISLKASKRQYEDYLLMKMMLKYLLQTDLILKFGISVAIGRKSCCGCNIWVILSATCSAHDVLAQEMKWMCFYCVLTPSMETSKKHLQREREMD